MDTTRRDFMRLGLGSTALLACGSTVPTFLANAAAALAAQPNKTSDHILVVVQLDGGNDGLNTVIPFKDDAYRKHRPRLQQPAAQLHKLDDRMALHSALAGLAKLHQDQRLAVVQSVGYPNPNRSHFESMSIWHTARASPRSDTAGWLANALEPRAQGGGDAPALHISKALLPQSLYGSSTRVPSLANLEQFRRKLGLPDGTEAALQRQALDRVAAEQRGPSGSLLQFIERSTVLTYTSSARLEGLMHKAKGGNSYPEYYGLSRRLGLIAQLIKAGLGTSIYYTELDGFDTHANQLGMHANLLRELGDSLQAFLTDLDKAGQAQRVVVLVLSEFGRRLTENASGGTDHGTAAPVFLLGAPVKAGLHGPCPDLHDLDSTGDPKFAIDFRRIYASVLEAWLGCPSATILGAKFEHLLILKSHQKNGERRV